MIELRLTVFDRAESGGSRRPPELHIGGEPVTCRSVSLHLGTGRSLGGFTDPHVSVDDREYPIVGPVVQEYHEGFTTFVTWVGYE